MIVFDCEIRTPIPNAEMSVCAWWNSETGLTEYVEYSDIELFIAEAQDADVIVGFNVLNFDYPLFERLGWEATDALEKTFDLERAVWYSITQGIRDRKIGKIDLDTLAQLNLGRGKLPLELPPLKLYNAGFVELVAAYCKQDVRLTRDLTFYATDYGSLFYENPEGQTDEVITLEYEEYIDDLRRTQVNRGLTW